MVNVLQGSTSAELHTNPKLITTQVTSIICDDVNVLAIFHHQYFLLDDHEIVPFIDKNPNRIRDYLIVIIGSG